MTKAPISQRITPSDEILREDGTIDSTGLLDEVSLYNLYDDRRSPEQDAERILKITYPTQTLQTIIQNTAQNLDSDIGFSEGGQIVGGGYGSGKSHIELVIYHLFNSASLGQSWLDKQGINVDLPSGTRTAALQMFNLEREYSRLSEAIGDYLGIDKWEGDKKTPTVHQIRDTLEGEPVLVLLDEFERWFGMPEREEYQDSNLAFLQNLLEAAGRDDTRLSVFVSLLYEDEDVQAITQRTNPFTHDLGSRRDEKIEFILHRLVGEVADPDGVANLAKEYTDVYRQNDQIQLEDYHDMQDRIERYYPFHPLALEVLMQKYSEQRISSDARGLLRFLTEILSDNYTQTDLILTGDINVYGYTDRFRYIDGELVGKYISDYNRLQKPDGSLGEFIEELINIVLVHSLSSEGEEGPNKRQMLMGVMRKGINAHRIIQTFTEDVYGHAWHIHRINGEYAFDTNENPAARIEKKAEDIHKHDAIHRVERLVREDIFNGQNNVYILDPINTEQDIPDNKTMKIVVLLRAKRDYNEIFEELTTGQEREFPNTLALVTPEKLAGINSNTGIRQLARKVVAGEQLKREEEALPDGFEEINDQNYQNLHDRVCDKFGTIHTSTGRGLYPENLPAGTDLEFYQASIDVISPDTSQLQSEIKNAVKDEGAKGIQYEYLRNDFYSDPSCSTLTDESELKDGINTLCQSGTLKVGTYFDQHVGSVGNDTTLVHEQHVETDEEEENEDPETITIDTTGSGVGGDGETTITGTGTGTGTPSIGPTSPSTVFDCPQCGEVLEDTTCECGFEFGASDVTDGKISVEGATMEKLLEEFGIEKPQEPKIRPYPAMGTIEANNKPELIDQLERETQGWEIHEATVSVDSVLTGNDLSKYGINASELSENVTLDETFKIMPDNPMTQGSFLGLLSNLNVPEYASLSVKLKVNKSE